jgi:hypothetical protein
VLADLADLATGLPDRQGLWLAAPAVIACLARGLSAHARRGAAGASLALAAFFGVGIAAAPALILALRPPSYLHARYFLLPLALLLLLLPAALPRRGSPALLRGACALAALLALAGNGAELADLARHGRGEYVRCLEPIAAEARARGTPVVVGVGSQFRIGSVTSFYLKRMGSLERVRLVPLEEGLRGADWLIVDPSSPLYLGSAPAREGLPRFELAQDCPAARGSGVPWRSFRRAAR